MTFYSLDLLVDQDSKFHIAEMGGVNSGMNGFRKIYGDNRVEQKVFQMLQERYGKLTWNDGDYHYQLFRKEHPLQFVLESKLGELLRPLFRGRNPFRKLSAALRSEKAIFDWWSEPPVYGPKTLLGKLELYEGQKSTVLNCLPETLPHPTVNSHVAEQIAGNKFLYYELLKNTELSDHLPPTVLVGCGWTDKKGITALLDTGDFFIRKPLHAEQGRGVRVINKDKLLSYEETAGPIKIFKSFPRYIFESYFVRDIRDVFWNLFSSDGSRFHEKKQKYLEEFAAENDFSFEPGMLVVQPFIRSTMNVRGQDLYSSVRSIVCNGQFVDAYARVGPDPISNLSRSALALPFEHSEVKEFSERVVQIYERECANYSAATFKSQLYESYFTEKGSRVTKEEIIRYWRGKNFYL